MQRKLGVGRGVAAVAERAGGAYVPMDPGYPRRAPGFLAEDSGIWPVADPNVPQDELPFTGTHSLTNLCLDDPEPDPERPGAVGRESGAACLSGASGPTSSIPVRTGAPEGRWLPFMARWSITCAGCRSWRFPVWRRTSGVAADLESFRRLGVGVFWLPLMSGAPPYTYECGTLGACGAGTSLESLWGWSRHNGSMCCKCRRRLLQALLPFAGDDQWTSLRLLWLRWRSADGALLLEQLGARWNGELVNRYGRPKRPSMPLSSRRRLRSGGGDSHWVQPIAGVRARNPRCGGWVCPVGCRANC